MADNSELQIGSTAPEFILPANTGLEIKLADFESKKNLVLFFVREFN
jgi:peroxiredoxin